MSKETLEYVVAKAKELIVAPSCSAEAKEAAQAWIAAVGTDKQAEETKKFIAEMEEEVNAELIIAVLRIAQRMKIRTTAEGLVTHAQLEELRQLGCDEAQGFLFSPAIPAEAATEFLKVGPRW